MFDKLLLALSLWTAPLAAPGDAVPLATSVPVGLDTWQRPDVWSVPVYVATRRDPLSRLLYNPNAWQQVDAGAWQRSNNSPEVEARILASSTPTFPYRGNVYSSTSASSWQLPASYNATSHRRLKTAATFRLNAGMTPAPGPDGHMAVMQPDGRVLETYATIRLASGTTVALSYAVTDPRSRGDGHQNGQTASMLPVYLGVLDDRSLNAGAIGHAMAITVPAGLLRPAFVYPAYAFDRGALTERQRYAGTLAMGSRLGLPASVDTAPLDLRTAEGRTIARAAREHGFIVVDRGGEGIALRVLRNPAEPNARLRHWNAPLQQDLQTIFARLVVVPPQHRD